MAKRVVRVVYKRGSWSVQKDRKIIQRGRFKTKKDAVSFGRGEVREIVRGNIEDRGVLIIHRRDGSIERSHGYGRDPRSPQRGGRQPKKGTSSTGPRRR